MEGMEGMEGMVGAMDEFGNCMTMVPNDCNGQGHTEQLLASLGEKLEQDRTENMVLDVSALAEGVNCAEGNWEENYAEGNWQKEGNWEGEEKVQQPWGDREGAGGRKNRNRDRGERGGRNNGAQEQQATEYSGKGESEVQGPVNFTTVMFRNIPNKYTRDMLVKQLEQDLRGQFDFVYLPIDFKNQCNVGYAFINFRSFEACQSFLQSFNGVEVRKCLPGLNSRKVTEVTPARVQGFEDNVQRLRNSPVMRELAHHPEWMPLIFDEDGTQLTFPDPERLLEPIKQRRRAREEWVAGAGA